MAKKDDNKPNINFNALKQENFCLRPKDKTI